MVRSCHCSGGMEVRITVSGAAVHRSVDDAAIAAGTTTSLGECCGQRRRHLRRKDSSSSALQSVHERCFPQGCPFNMFNQLHVHPGLHNAGLGEGVGD